MLLGMPPYFSTNFLVILNLSLFPLTFNSWSFCSKVSWAYLLFKEGKKWVQGFCPPSSRRQGAGVPRPVECDARTLSKERVQKRSPRLLRISETTAEKGEYLLGGVFTRPCDKNGTQGVCVAQRAVFCVLRSRSRARSFASVVLAKRTMQQCKGLPWEPCRAAFSIPFHRTPLQCCNLHRG